MGCDIHSVAEKRREDGTWQAVENVGFNGCYSYKVFAFLAGVRNSFDVPPISEPRGIPTDVAVHAPVDCEPWGFGYAHSSSWLSVEELEAFDYEREFARWVGRSDFENEFEMTTYKRFLGSWFFENLAEMKAAGAERVVFWFDN